MFDSGSDVSVDTKYVEVDDQATLLLRYRLDVLELQWQFLRRTVTLVSEAAPLTTTEFFKQLRQLERVVTTEVGDASQPFGIIAAFGLIGMQSYHQGESSPNEFLVNVATEQMKVISKKIAKIAVELQACSFDADIEIPSGG